MFAKWLRYQAINMLLERENQAAPIQLSALERIIRRQGALPSLLAVASILLTAGITAIALGVGLPLVLIVGLLTWVVALLYIFDVQARYHLHIRKSQTTAMPAKAQNEPIVLDEATLQKTDNLALDNYSLYARLIDLADPAETPDLQQMAQAGMALGYAPGRPGLLAASEKAPEILRPASQDPAWKALAPIVLTAYKQGDAKWMGYGINSKLFVTRDFELLQAMRELTKQLRVRDSKYASLVGVFESLLEQAKQKPEATCLELTKENKEALAKFDLLGQYLFAQPVKQVLAADRGVQYGQFTLLDLGGIQQPRPMLFDWNQENGNVLVENRDYYTAQAAEASARHQIHPSSWNLGGQALSLLLLGIARIAGSGSTFIGRACLQGSLGLAPLDYYQRWLQNLKQTGKQNQLPGLAEPHNALQHALNNYRGDIFALQIDLLEALRWMALSQENPEPATAGYILAAMALVDPQHVLQIQKPGKPSRWMPSLLATEMSKYELARFFNWLTGALGENAVNLDLLDEWIKRIQMTQMAQAA
jgi:hypothetical protein